MHVSLIVSVASIEVTSYERHGVSNIGNATVCATGCSSEQHKKCLRINRWPMNSLTVGHKCGKCFHVMSTLSYHIWYLLIHTLTAKSNIRRLALLNSVFLAHFKIHTECLRGSGKWFCSMYNTLKVKIYEFSMLKNCIHGRNDPISST